MPVTESNATRRSTHLFNPAQEGPCAEPVIQVSKDVWPDEVCCLFGFQEGLERESMHTSWYR